MKNEIGLLAELVAMPTITDDVHANDLAIDFVEAYLRKRGMACTRHVFGGRSALTASTGPKERKKPFVQFSAHMDVVPADESLFTLRQ